MLARRNLVMLRLGLDAELPQFLVQLGHVGEHTFLDDAEIMIAEFLSFRCRRAEKRPSREHDIHSLHGCLAVNQEILLLRAHTRDHALCLRIAEKPQDPQRLSVDRLHGFEQRRLHIQRLAVISTEYGRNAQDRGAVREFLDKGR